MTRVGTEDKRFPDFYKVEGFRVPSTVNRKSKCVRTRLFKVGLELLTWDFPFSCDGTPHPIEMVVWFPNPLSERERPTEKPFIDDCVTKTLIVNTFLYPQPAQPSLSVVRSYVHMFDRDLRT